MPINEWFHKQEKYIKLSPDSKKEMPEGVWIKCEHCGMVCFQKELERNLKVCPKCDFHMSLTAAEKIALLADNGDFDELDVNLTTTDPLGFIAAKSYVEVIREAKERTDFSEAVITGTGKLGGRKICLGVMDFAFVGGSMGSVVGEKIARLVERATKEKTPLVIVCSSGGARMQEGMFSLMQMAKTSAALARLHDACVPYISILTHPTTGGVTASFATLADVILAEKNALIGFAGPRVIEQTIRQKLPRGFQTAEFLLEHGQVDLVVHRKDLKETVVKLLDFLAV